MIDFACKRFNLDEIIKCSLELTKGEYNVMGQLVKNPEKEYTTHELSQELGLNLTTIQKAVKKLAEKDIVFRKQHNLDNGGYIFTYRSKSKDLIKKLIKDIICQWAARVEKAIDNW